MWSVASYEQTSGAGATAQGISLYITFKSDLRAPATFWQCGQGNLSEMVVVSGNY